MNDIIAVLKDLLQYLRETRKIYITLLIGFFVLMGLIIVLAEGSAVMPFIYTLF
jgi:hypothetical protein